MEQTLNALAAYLKGRVIGDGAVLIRDINHLDAVQDGEIAFADDAHNLAKALASRASAILVGPHVTELQGRSGISVHDPKLAFALLLTLFHPDDLTLTKGGVHPSAQLGQGVSLGKRTEIRANAVLGNRVQIGEGTIIEPGTYLGDGVIVGDQCILGPNVTVYRDTVIGHRVRIHGGSVIGGDGFGYVFHEGRYVKVPQVGNVIIEDDVEIGCNSCVDRATIGSTLIRRGTKMDNLVQVAHNNRIGQHVVLAGQVGLAGSVTVGDYARFGGQAGVIDHLAVGAQAEVGAGCLVTKSIPPKIRVWGWPARPAKETLQQLASARRLPSLVKRLAGLLRQMAGLDRRVRQLEQRFAPQEPAAPS